MGLVTHTKCISPRAEHCSLRCAHRTGPEQLTLPGTSVSKGVYDHMARSHGYCADLLGLYSEV